jgi:hypothetical protein
VKTLEKHCVHFGRRVYPGGKLLHTTAGREARRHCSNRLHRKYYNEGAVKCYLQPIAEDIFVAPLPAHSTELNPDEQV